MDEIKKLKIKLQEKEIENLNLKEIKNITIEKEKNHVTVQKEKSAVIDEEKTPMEDKPLFELPPISIAINRQLEHKS